MRRAILAEEHSDEMRRCEPPDDTLSGERQEALALERSPGIAPGFRAWRALVLLLNYDRKT
jgi:hypothetical protein